MVRLSNFMLPVTWTRAGSMSNRRSRSASAWARMENVEIGSVIHRNQGFSFWYRAKDLADRRPLASRTGILSLQAGVEQVGPVFRFDQNQDRRVQPFQQGRIKKGRSSGSRNTGHSNSSLARAYPVAVKVDKTTVRSGYRCCKARISNSATRTSPTDAAWTQRHPVCRGTDFHCRVR